jgi:predicted nucleic acid-binding Zn ribbon protein
MTDDRRRSDLTPIGTVLQGVLGQLGLQERLAERRLLEAWPQIVGEEIASHSRAIDIAGGILTLQADHGVWRHELTLLIPEIIARYNEVFGEGTVCKILWDRRLPRRPCSENRG